MWVHFQVTRRTAAFAGGAYSAVSVALAVAFLVRDKDFCCVGGASVSSVVKKSLNTEFTEMLRALRVKT